MGRGTVRGVSCGLLLLPLLSMAPACKSEAGQAAPVGTTSGSAPVVVPASASASSVAEAPVPTPRVDAPSGTAVAERTPAQIARRERSRAKVQKLGWPVSDAQPDLADEAQITPRSLIEVTDRTGATAFCASVAHDERWGRVKIHETPARAMFTPLELEFMQSRDPPPAMINDFGWSAESAHVFLWSLGFLPRIHEPAKPCNPPAELRLITAKTAQGTFQSEAKLRPLAELLDEADFYYRLLWAIEERQARGAPVGEHDRSIAQERFRALSWLIRRGNRAWDDADYRTDAPHGGGSPR